MDETGPDDLFDSPPDPALDRLTGLAATVLGVPVSLISLIDDRRQFFKSIYGLTGWAAEARGTPLSHSFCKHVVAGDTVLAVENAPEHPVLCNNGAIADLGVIAYLGVPVHTADGKAIGSFCAIDGTPRRWSESDREVLTILALACETEITLHQTLLRQAQTIRALDAANAALSAEREVAERALQDRTRLFSALGHDLKTPLNGILGGVELLGRTEDPGKRETFMAMIRDSAAALNRFVDDVVGFAAAQSGALPLNPAAMVPAAPLDETLAGCAAIAAQRGLSLRREIADGLPAIWVSDHRRIVQILTNLVGNALKYTAEGSVGLSLGLEDGILVYRVRDTGPGVPASQREAIFKPFHRGDPATAASAPGSGLGLAMARTMAEGLGGTLDLEPARAGEGASFVLRVPPLSADLAADAA